MPYIATDLTRLREPALLVPGRKPYGSVKVNRSHPLVRDMLIFAMAGNDGGTNLVDRISGTLSKGTTHTNVTNGIDRFGQYIAFTADNNAEAYTTGQAFVDKIQDGDFAVSFRVRVPSLSSSAYMRIAGFGGFDPGFYLETGTSPNPVGIYDSSYSNGTINLNGISNEPHDVTFMINAATDVYQMYVDGKDAGSGSKSMAIGPSDEFEIGSDGANDTLYLYDIIAWNRWPNQAEISSLYQDRYQFLISA